MESILAYPGGRGKPKVMYQLPHNKRVQPDFGELTLASAADAKLHGLPLLSSKDAVDQRH